MKCITSARKNLTQRRRDAEKREAENTGHGWQTRKGNKKRRRGFTTITFRRCGHCGEQAVAAP
jgi:hypothetical protein